MSESVGQQATTVGLNYNFDGMKPTNTFDAHRLAKFAETKGKEAEVTERLLKGDFIESKQIGNHQTLLQIAQDAGLNSVEVELSFDNGEKFEAINQRTRLDQNSGGLVIDLPGHRRDIDSLT